MMHFRRKRACRFCVDTELTIDYKNPRLLQGYITERSKILPGRITGSCAFHQRKLTEAIKRARHLALLSYSLPLHTERVERFERPERPYSERAERVERPDEA